MFFKLAMKGIMGAFVMTGFSEPNHLLALFTVGLLVMVLQVTFAAVPAVTVAREMLLKLASKAVVVGNVMFFVTVLLMRLAMRVVGGWVVDAVMPLGVVAGAVMAGGLMDGVVGRFAAVVMARVFLVALVVFAVMLAVMLAVMMSHVMLLSVVYPFAAYVMALAVLVALVSGVKFLCHLDRDASRAALGLPAMSNGRHSLGLFD